MRTAIVAGATRLVGRELVQKLIRSNHYRLIYILTRKKSGIVRKENKELQILRELQHKTERTTDQLMYQYPANISKMQV